MRVLAEIQTFFVSFCWWAKLVTLFIREMSALCWSFLSMFLINRSSFTCQSKIIFFYKKIYNQPNRGELRLYILSSEPWQWWRIVHQGHTNVCIADNTTWSHMIILGGFWTGEVSVRWVCSKFKFITLCGMCRDDNPRRIKYTSYNNYTANIVNPAYCVTLV